MDSEPSCLLLVSLFGSATDVYLWLFCVQFVNDRMNTIESRLETTVSKMAEMEEEAVNAVKEACENAAKSLLDSFDNNKFVKKKKGVPITAPLRMIPGIT
eukprot:COSAG05_NODE_925_length_6575_cov_68.709320_1_plen_100_part_00